MPDVPKSDLNPWTDALLNPMRQVGDELADAVISELFTQSEVTAVNSLMKNLVTNEFPEPETLPPIVRDYLLQTDQLPQWADPKLIESGEQVFWRFGSKIILILHGYSLPFDYLGKKGVQVLALTTRLVSNPTRRITEVAQFLVDVLQPGGLTTAGGRGRRSIQKVRLMHGAVRRLALGSPNWNKDWDVPINQEDLAGTLMSFSWVVLDGLEKMGVSLSEADREGYLHCWLVAGELLGIRHELLPKSVESARELTAAVARRQFGPSEEGKAMTHALTESMANILPGDVFHHAIPLLIRYFLGEERAGWLGIEGPDYAAPLLAPLRVLGVEASTLLRNSEALSHLAEKVGRLLIESIVYVERGGNRPSFTIPVELRQQWGVNWLS